MRTEPLNIAGGSSVAAVVAGAELPCRIHPDHRRFTLVQRDAAGDVLPCQSPEYAEAMAQSIETCARDIGRGEVVRFAALWARASSALGSFFLGRRGLSLVVRPNRSQGDLMAAARMLNELEPAGMATAHAEYSANRTQFIAQRILDCANRLIERGVFDAAAQCWTLGDYALARVDAPAIERIAIPGGRDFELRIASPRPAPQVPHTFAAWRIKSADGERPEQLRHRMFENSGFADAGYLHAASAHINQLLDGVRHERVLSQRLDRAYEAYWWMLRQTQEAVGDKAQHVLQAVLLSTGHDLPPSPCGVDPALEALSRSLPEWRVRAPEIWGHGVGPHDFVMREVTGRFPNAKRAQPQSAAPHETELEMLLGSSPGRLRRAQIEAAWETLHANLKIA